MNSKLVLQQRPRRNRKNETVRNMVAETQLAVDQLVWPLFLQEGVDVETPIKALPGCFRYSPDRVIKSIGKYYERGLRSFALFPSVHEALKNSSGSECYNPNGLIPNMVKKIKDLYPESVVITDVALDPYSSDGHDGLVKDGVILNDETVDILCRQAMMQAKAGADFVAPSDMMDGRVGAIRKALDQEGFCNTGIISYSAKYASSFYGPFREALDSAPKFGDKKTYQMDYRNSTEALREALLDVEEGADVLMVKPALAYLDIIQQIKRTVNIPVAAYNVSGEYAMIKFAAAQGVLDAERAMLEVLFSIRRAGADMIFTYFAPEMAELLTRR